jgi:CHAD domain-containing protein
MDTYTEVEDKYDVGEEFVLPSLTGAGDIASVAEPRTDELVAVYYDTADFRLARSRIVLRRRRGGADAGWHLKLPGSSARTEVHRPLGRGERVPPDLGNLVYAHTRGLPLSPVGRLSTKRMTYQLCDASGRVLAELADDRVHAELFADQGRAVELSAWREVEIELVDGDRKVLKHTGRRLVDGGAKLSRRPSKFGGLLGSRVDVTPELPAAVAELDRRSSAREVIQAYLSTQAAALLEADLRVRLDAPDSIHDLRVASRRIRSSLKTFRRLLVSERARDLEARLRDIGLQLGVARDNEVLLERLLGSLDGLPDTYVLGPVRRRLQEELHGTYLRSRSEALSFMQSPAYAALLDDLMRFISDGFVDDVAERPAGKALPRMVRRSSRKLVLRVEAAREARDGDELEHALHQVRKAAKQARYAGEAVEPAFGRAAAQLAKQAKGIQEILGDHQDSVVAADVLRRLGIEAQGRPEESAFTFGLLAGLERAHAAHARRRFDALWSKTLARGLVRPWT